MMPPRVNGHSGNVAYGGLVLSASPSQDTIYSQYTTSPMSDHVGQVPDGGAPGGDMRRSTGSSDALQYYWSSSAGERASSFTSSFGLSPKDSPRAVLSSPYSLSAHPVLHEANSNVSLREMAQRDAEYLRTSDSGSGSAHKGSSEHLLPPDSQASRLAVDTDRSSLRDRNTPVSEAGPSNRRIHLVWNSSDGSVSGLASAPSSGSIGQTPPGSHSRHSSTNSSESEYSLVDEDASAPRREHALPPAPSSHRHGVVDTDGNLGMLLDPGLEDWTSQRLSPVVQSPATQSPATQSPQRPNHPPELVVPAPRAPRALPAIPVASPVSSNTGSGAADSAMWRTPSQPPQLERPLISPVNLSAIVRTPSPGAQSSGGDSTPRNSIRNSARDSTQTVRSSQTARDSLSPLGRDQRFAPPSSGRLLFVAPPDVSRRSLDELEREYVGLGLDDARGERGGRVGLAIGNPRQDSMPHSAPPLKTGFGEIEIPGQRARPTSLLPPAVLAARAARPRASPRSSLSTPVQESPELPEGTPRTARPPTLEAPELPPRSQLRRPSPTPSNPDRRSPVGRSPASSTRSHSGSTPPGSNPVVGTPVGSTRSTNSPNRGTPDSTAARSDRPTFGDKLVTPPDDLALPLQPPVTLHTPQMHAQRLSATQLPTIINTPHTPVASPRAPRRGRSGSSPAAASSAEKQSKPSSGSRGGTPVKSSGTLQDLTDILSGAIDDIGLVDSRDMPPPSEPSKINSNANVGRRQSPVHHRAMTAPSSVSPNNTEHPGLSPTNSVFPSSTAAHASPRPPIHHHAASAGSIGLGLGNLSTSPAPPHHHRTTASSASMVTRHVRKASSILSMRTTASSPTVSTFPPTGPGAFPAAVMYGNIKQLKTSAERARAYSAGVRELARADTGLRDWVSFYQSGGRIAITQPHKQSAMAQLGVAGHEREPSGPGGLGVPEPAFRNVSASSEFPMRPDAYTAQAISVRNIDVLDGPTALPPNLPYPQLQNAIKSSGSMQSIQSIATIASQRGGRGLLSALRLKKEKENTSLPPPTGYANLGTSPGGGAAKRSVDLRTVTIGNPSYSPGPGPGRSSLDSADPAGRLQPPMSGPRGPRGPHDGPLPARASFDLPRSLATTGLPRTSLDSPRPSPISRGSSGSGQGPVSGPLGHGGSPLPPSVNLANMNATLPSLPREGSPLARSAMFVPTDEDIRLVSDMLPQAERPVLRRYLERYGDTSDAMTAYIEDEQHGTLLRA